MKMNYFAKNKPRGFTLVELVVSLTIFSFLMISLILTYTSISDANKRLEILRVVQESTRDVTELLANEVGNFGADFSVYTPSELDGVALKSLTIKRSGASSIKYFLVKQIDTGSWVGCDDGDNTNFAVQCRLGIMENTTIKPISSADTSIKNLVFFVSGNDNESLTNQSKEGKVQVKFDIGIPVKKGVKTAVAKESYVTIQTTLSEKVWKKNTY